MKKSDNSAESRNEDIESLFIILIVITLVISVCTFSIYKIRLHYARMDNVVVSGDENPGNYIYNKDLYYVGEDIKPGLYKVFSDTYWGYYEEIYLSNRVEEGENIEDIYESCSFAKFSYVDLKEKMKIKLENCYLVPIDKAASFEEKGSYLPPNNVYMVGKDIKEGEYSIVAASPEEIDRGFIRNLIFKTTGYYRKDNDTQPGYDIFNNLSKVYKYASDDFKKENLELKIGQYLYLIKSSAEFLK